MHKNHFLLVKKFQNTSSAQLWTATHFQARIENDKNMLSCREILT